MGRVVEVFCAYCGLKFKTKKYSGLQSYRKYCSNICRYKTITKTKDNTFKNRKEKYGKYWLTEKYRESQRKSKRKRFEELRNEVFKKLGSCCNRCGIDDKRVLCVDHVNGDGALERKIKTSVIAYYKKIINDAEGRYQILCHNCNWIKRFENNEIRKPEH